MEVVGLLSLFVCIICLLSSLVSVFCLSSPRSSAFYFEEHRVGQQIGNGVAYNVGQCACDMSFCLLMAVCSLKLAHACIILLSSCTAN